eukprot:5753603-Amphidinium_carterae.1
MADLVPEDDLHLNLSEDELSSGSNATEDDQEEHGQALLSYLMKLRHSGKLHANDVCIIAYHASNAGARGSLLKSVAMPPDRQSGNYSRHLETAMKRETVVPEYILSCPGWSRREKKRTIME